MTTNRFICQLKYACFVQQGGVIFSSDPMARQHWITSKINLALVGFKNAATLPTSIILTSGGVIDSKLC